MKRIDSHICQWYENSTCGKSFTEAQKEHLPSIAQACIVVVLLIHVLSPAKYAMKMNNNQNNQRSCFVVLHTARGVMDEAEGNVANYWNSHLSHLDLHIKQQSFGTVGHLRAPKQNS